MKCFRIPLFIGVLFLTACGIPKNPGLYTDNAYDKAINACRELLQDQVQDQYPGYVIAVAKDNQLLWKEGFGFANIEKKIPMSADDELRSYSVAKNWTSTAAIKLVEAGKLDFQSKLKDLISDIPFAWDEITVYQLGTHHSGIRHYRDDQEAANPGNCQTIDQALELFKNDPLVHQPGKEYLYSTWGYVVLSKVIAEVSGETYLQAMNELVFNPASMKVGFAGQTTPGIQYYNLNPATNSWILSDANPSCKWGGGGLIATVESLVHFDQAMLQGILVNSDMTNLVLEPNPDSIAITHGISEGGWASVYTDMRNGISIAFMANARGKTMELPEIERLLKSIESYFSKS